MCRVQTCPAAYSPLGLFAAVPQLRLRRGWRRGRLWPPGWHSAIAREPRILVGLGSGGAALAAASPATARSGRAPLELPDPVLEAGVLHHEYVEAVQEAPEYKRQDADPAHSTAQHSTSVRALV